MSAYPPTAAAAGGDAALAADIRARLAADPEVEGAPIGVTVHDGAVTLDGTARAYARAAAEHLAAAVPGVRAVANAVRVIDPWRPDNDDLARLIREGLANDQMVAHEDISVTVTDRAVILTGTVPTGAERAAAERIAADVEGELRGGGEMVNRIAVMGKPAGPERIASRIERAFIHTALTDVSRIIATVEDGRVELDGTVRDETSRQLAERAALATPGILAVDNRLRIAPIEPGR
ncbi:MAG: BON domain-containing protein [Thermomicrobiales bacterium]